MRTGARKRTKPKPVNPPPSATLAVVWVDGTAIRQKLKKQYDKAVRDLAKARAKLEHFQTVDVPAFQRWLSTTFGALLTDLRETARKLQVCELTLREIELEMFFTGASAHKAYQRVMQRQNEPASGEGFPPLDDDQPGSGHASNHGHHSQDSRQEDPFEFPPPPPDPRNRLAPREAARLKELYRILARRLHPDAQKQHTPQMTEWWHQAQAAYEQGDVEQLETILAFCDMDAKGRAHATSASLLQKITQELERTLRQVKRDLTKCRRETAWNFSARKDKEALTTSLSREFLINLAVLKDRLREAEVLLARRAAKPRPRRGTSRNPRREAFDPFTFYF